MPRAAPATQAPGGTITEKTLEGIRTSSTSVGLRNSFLSSDMWKTAVLGFLSLSFCFQDTETSHYSGSLKPSWWQNCCLQYSSRWKDFFGCLVTSQPDRDPVWSAGSYYNSAFSILFQPQQHFLLYTKIWPVFEDARLMCYWKIRLFIPHDNFEAVWPN